jgi:glutathione S-transferase
MIKLYGHVNRKSPNTLKLRAALAESGVRYEYVVVNLDAGEQKRPEFLALNPHGKIPVLVETDEAGASFALAESDAILWYIAERFPQAGLLPGARAGLTQAQARARVLQWCDFTSTGLYAAYLDLYIHTVKGAPDKRVSWIGEAAGHKMSRLMGVLDGVLAGRAGGYLAGDFSIADLAAAAVLQTVKSRIAPDPSADRPHIAAWYARVTSRPAWQSAIDEAEGGKS